MCTHSRLLDKSMVFLGVISFQKIRRSEVCLESMVGCFHVLTTWCPSIWFGTEGWHQTYNPKWTPIPPHNMESVVHWCVPRCDSALLRDDIKNSNPQASTWQRLNILHLWHLVPKKSGILSGPPIYVKKNTTFTLSNAAICKMPCQIYCSRLKLWYAIMDPARVKESNGWCKFWTISWCRFSLFCQVPCVPVPPNIPTVLPVSDLFSSKTESRPNILLILADDLGWHDLSWHNPRVIIHINSMLKVFGTIKKTASEMHEAPRIS